MNREQRTALKVAGGYAVFGALWIALSDRLLAAVVTDPVDLIYLQTYKGWFFIAVTAVLVFFLSRRALTDLAGKDRAEEKLRHLAHHDSLTSLPNRRLLEERLDKALAQAPAMGGRIGVLLLDIDRFKLINDTLGHGAGDELLLAVAQRLECRLRPGDTLSRIAGNQFVILYETLRDGVELEDAARDLNGALEPPFILGGDALYVQASIGLSFFPEDGATAHDLLRGAAAAVHQAKEAGGGQYRFCTAQLNAQAREVLQMEGALRQALEQQEFVLHYQPKIDLPSGRIIGAEALLRWDRPGRGLVAPGEFIPLAEKSGLIVPIGAEVIAAVCRQLSRWRAEGVGPIQVSLNVSARQFRSGDLEGTIAACLERCAIAPSALTVELTESMLMSDPHEAAARLGRLKGTGIRISLDDFGTGYSSLAYLSRFPIDELKIDQTFVRDIDTDPSAATIAASIIALAHRMRLKVVAEGVETEGQLAYLRRNGCDEVQGYYFSRPLPPEEFAELVVQGGKSLASPPEKHLSAS